MLTSKVRNHGHCVDEENSEVEKAANERFLEDHGNNALLAGITQTDAHG